MLLRLCSLIVVVAAAGCGGAFGGTVSLVPRPAVGAVTDRFVRVAGDVGDRFVYAGVLTKTVDGRVMRASVRQTVTVTATPYPYGRAPGSVDFHSAEWDYFPGGNRRWTADAWRGDGAPERGVTPRLLYGSHVDDGNSELYRYPVALVLDRVPERNGATWSNSASLVYDEKDRNGTSGRIDYGSRGAYSERVLYPSYCGAGRCELDVTAALGGSAAYAGSALVASGIASIAIGAPKHASIAIVFTLDDRSKRTFHATAWFAPGAKLNSESDVIHTGVTYPRSCAVPKYFGTAGNVIVREVARIDPAAGYSETQETHTYTSGRHGAVCLAMSDVRLGHYDFTNDRFSGKPIAQTSITEILSLRSERSAMARQHGVAANEAAAIVLERFRVRPVGAILPRR
jgi:hypothetical protein